MGTFIDFLQGFGWAIFRLFIGILGLIAYTYFVFSLVSIIRGPRAAGVLRHGNVMGVFCLVSLTFVGLAFLANALKIPGWEAQGRGAIVFYSLVVSILIMSAFFANLTIWKVSFSSDYIVESRSFWRTKSVKWIDVASWSLCDETKSMILKMRGGGVFSIFFTDVDGAEELFEALEARGIPREDLASPAEAEA